MHGTAAESVLSRLRAIQEAFLTSAFASRHSFVGTSLLFIVEQGGHNRGTQVIWTSPQNKAKTTNEKHNVEIRFHMYLSDCYALGRVIGPLTGPIKGICLRILWTFFVNM